MKWVNGDIWIYWKLGKIIVIPTNAGWKSDGSNVMGRGLAKQASEKIIELPFRYGNDCIKREPYQYYEDIRLILVPTKPLNEEQPYLSWKQDANKETITDSLIWLNENVESFKSDKVYVPILGAGNGKMDKNMVKLLMDKYLKHPKFIGVEIDYDPEKKY